jgi:hypothetical protein
MVILRRSGLATAVVCGVMLTAVSLPAAGALSVGRPGSVPAVPASSDAVKQLLSVYCTSPTNCWAVGTQGNPNLARTQMLHWNGKKWSAASHVANPSGVDPWDYVSSVRCVHARDCWAVGNFTPHNQPNVTRAEVLHWNGHRWSSERVPQPGGSGMTELRDSVCVSASNCWAVGAYGTAAGLGLGKTLILHWNGTRWGGVAGVPSPASYNVLNSVRCVSATDCFAVGINRDHGTDSNLVLHWNGKTWSLQTTPNKRGTGRVVSSELDALACKTATSCWAVGSYATTGFSFPHSLNQVLHWNGKKWTKASVPNPGGTVASSAYNVLTGATCSSLKNCWSVGGYTGGNESLHWNGKKWSVVETPNVAGVGNILNAVRCTSARDCWTVGATQLPNEAIADQILHWNGKKWTIVD